MTFGELRRLLNTVPITADLDHVMFLDDDSGDAFDVNAVEHRADEEAVWLRGALL